MTTARARWLVSAPVDELAAQLAPELRRRAAARASVLAPLLVVLFLVPFYVVPENSAPITYSCLAASFALLVAATFLAIESSPHRRRELASD